MGQRLGLAAALLGDPECLILDEPVNGLDPEGIHWVRTFLQNLASQGRTVLVSSHLLSEMAHTADHLIVIGRGRLVADTPMKEFVRAHSASTVVVRTSDQEALSAALQRAQVAFNLTSDALGRPAFNIHDVTTDDIGRLAFEQGIGLLELSETTASLEEAFLETTGDAVQYQASNKGVSQ